MWKLLCFLCALLTGARQFQPTTKESQQDVSDERLQSIFTPLALVVWRRRWTKLLHAMWWCFRQFLLMESYWRRGMKKIKLEAAGRGDKNFWCNQLFISICLKHFSSHSFFYVAPELNVPTGYWVITGKTHSRIIWAFHVLCPLVEMFVHCSKTSLNLKTKFNGNFCLKIDWRFSKKKLKFFFYCHENKENKICSKIKFLNLIGIWTIFRTFMAFRLF